MGCMSSNASDARPKNDDQALAWAKSTEAAGIMADKVTDNDKTAWKNARAQKKFKALDTDGSGNLEQAELDQLAEWVWGSFNPKQFISS